MKRFVIRFNLRFCFIVVTALAVTMGIASHRVHRMRAAKLAIENLGGQAWFDNHCFDDATPRGPFVDPARRNVLSPIFQSDYFRSVVFVDLKGSNIRDSDLVVLRKFPYLRRISLDRTKVTDTGLIHLASLKGLRHVHLNSTLVTAEGVAQLLRTRPEIEIVGWDEAFEDEAFERVWQHISEAFDTSDTDRELPKWLIIDP